MFASFAPLNIDENKEVMSTRDITFEAYMAPAMLCSVAPFSFPNKWPTEEEDGTWEKPIFEEESNQNEEELDIRDDQYAVTHKFIACCMMYRGDLMPATVNRAMQDFTETAQPEFSYWVPSGFKVGINSPPIRTPESWTMKNMSRSLTNIINNTVICEKFKQIVRNYASIQNMEGYLHWNTIGGISREILDACKDGIVSQISQYEHCMSEEIAIDSLKEKLEERPDEIGDYQAAPEPEEENATEEI